MGASSSSKRHEGRAPLARTVSMPVDARPDGRDGFGSFSALKAANRLQTLTRLLSTRNPSVHNIEDAFCNNGRQGSWELLEALDEEALSPFSTHLLDGNNPSSSLNPSLSRIGKENVQPFCHTVASPTLTPTASLHRHLSFGRARNTSGKGLDCSFKEPADDSSSSSNNNSVLRGLLSPSSVDIGNSSPFFGYIENLRGLEAFELKCPPGGDGKVVLYFTSLRIVRKTFDRCSSLRFILKGLRVEVDERDIWMHQEFRRELSELFGRHLPPPPVPILFINGRHIGGADEVQQLHEEGILASLLSDLPSLRPPGSVCEGCGDVRFIPCITCSGSCKLLAEEGDLIRCSQCNENGLIMCPICS